MKEIFKELVDALLSIPATFWAAIFGSFVSLVGILITNSHSLKRLREQFVHEQSVKKAEREWNMKKETLLTASEVMAEGVSSLMRFSNLDIPDDQVLNRNSDKSGSIAKAQLIGDSEVRETISELGAQLTAAYLRLSLKRAPLRYIQGKSLYYGERIKETLERQAQTNNLMTNYNREGVIDRKKWGVLENDFAFHAEAFKELSKKLDATNTDLFQKRVQLIEDCYGEMSEVIEAYVNAEIALRKALNLDADKVELLKSVQRRAEEIYKSVRDFTEQARSFISDPPNDEW